MSDDYLWDRSGPPDPEIARLEALLRPFGHQDTGTHIPLKLDARGTSASDWRESAGPTATAWTRRNAAYALAATVLLLAVGGWWFASRRASGSWDVVLFDAGVDTASARATGQGDLPVGGWLETGDRQQALVRVARIGNVTLDPRTRVRLVRTRANEHRLELARGTLHAAIVAPPGQFFVETSSATVVDLGCAYTLTADERGVGTVTVKLGWVAFQSHARESLIPAGFTAVTRAGIGPGTPQHNDTTAAVRAALETIDFGSDAKARSDALEVVLAHAGERDEVTLWHLLTRAPAGDCDRVFDRLAMFVPPPAGVTHEGVRAGRADMLDRWWDAMGLGAIDWWRTWRTQGG